MPYFYSLKMWSFLSFIGDRLFLRRLMISNNSSRSVPVALNISLLVIFFSSWITWLELGDLTNDARVDCFFILLVNCIGYFVQLSSPLGLFSPVFMSSSKFHFSRAWEILFCNMLVFFVLWFRVWLPCCPFPFEVMLLMMLTMLSFLYMPKGDTRLFLVD